MENQWIDFSDFDLAMLCGTYGMRELPKFKPDFFTLQNRAEVERRLTEYEMNLAFSKNDVDSNYKLA